MTVRYITRMFWVSPFAGRWGSSALCGWADGRPGVPCENLTDASETCMCSGADEFAGVWLRSRAASVPEIPPPVHTQGEVRAWFREVVLLECEVWVADDDGVIALLVLKDDWIDQLYVDARSACASRQ